MYIYLVRTGPTSWALKQNLPQCTLIPPCHTVLLSNPGRTHTLLPHDHIPPSFSSPPPLTYTFHPSDNKDPVVTGLVRGGRPGTKHAWGPYDVHTLYYFVHLYTLSKNILFKKKAIIYYYLWHKSLFHNYRVLTL